MAPHDGTVSPLRQLLPLDDSALRQIVDHAAALADTDAAAQTPPSYASTVRSERHHHTNAFIAAADLRARTEQQMQQRLQMLQHQYGIYNREIVPVHECLYFCECVIHKYQFHRDARMPALRRWSEAVQYPGESFYNENSLTNPYTSVVKSLFQARCDQFGARPAGRQHTAFLLSMIALNNKFNDVVQASVDRHEPVHSIWAADDDDNADAHAAAAQPPPPPPPPKSRFERFRRSLGGSSPEEKIREKAAVLRNAILVEETGRWPDPAWRRLVAAYQASVGMADQITALRAHCPIQYLHLLRAGYFEPIPVAWATKASNPLMFSIEPENGVRGVTPAWRGYENLAEERLYWVLNHRAAAAAAAGAGYLKPDPISALCMAHDRMARAVQPPPLYFTDDDTCMVQHTAATTGYSKQVLPGPLHADGHPEQPGDNTMILLDVSGSMDFDPKRPIYDQYLITGYAQIKQPKNRDVARAIVRRFTDAMDHRHGHHADQPPQGYDFVTFSDRAAYLGPVHHANLDAVWDRVVFGGRTRVMAGWQLTKDLHFQKHAATATYHPVYGWQAGPATPVLRLLLVLDSEAANMDAFELDLLGLAWAHVTVFLVGTDGCLHHHRQANELQRISDANPRVSFVDAQGNCPERFVTHELLKRHLGCDLPLHDFEEMERVPEYAEPLPVYAERARPVQDEERTPDPSQG